MPRSSVSTTRYPDSAIDGATRRYTLRRSPIPGAQTTRGPDVPCTSYATVPSGVRSSRSGGRRGAGAPAEFAVILMLLGIIRTILGNLEARRGFPALERVGKGSGAIDASRAIDSSPPVRKSTDGGRVAEPS